VKLLSQAEVDWLNAYHAEVRNIVRAQLDESDKLWLDVATAPLN
jgi:Xaa-Pro aminopeptidase